MDNVGEADVLRQEIEHYRSLLLYCTNAAVAKTVTELLSETTQRLNLIKDRIN